MLLSHDNVAVIGNTLRYSSLNSFTNRKIKVSIYNRLIFTMSLKKKKRTTNTL